MLIPPLFLLWLFSGLPTVPAPPAAKACVNPTCGNPPCAASLRGDVGCTTVSGTSLYSHELLNKGDTIATAAHIYGPFEAGFSAQQKNIIEGWGCSDPSVAYDTEGGLDLKIATSKVAKLCGIDLPRLEGTKYIGIVGHCGGHTKDYHFHVAFSCLFQESGAHSTAVGEVAQYKLYGKWDDYANKKLPYLDACSAHFGVTPDSTSSVYHYHVQDNPPFAVGCHGPDTGNKLVSVQKCFTLYTACKSCTVEVIAQKTGTTSYCRNCPCWDANVLNTGGKTGSFTELPALSTSDTSYASNSTNTPSPTPAPAALVSTSVVLELSRAISCFLAASLVSHLYLPKQ